MIRNRFIIAMIYVSLQFAAVSVASDENAETLPVEDRRPVVIVVVGHAGESEYGEMFAAWAARWKSAAQQGKARFVQIGGGEPATAGVSDRERLHLELSALEKSNASALWLILIGHGTFDGKDAKLNLVGPDATAKEVALWLDPLPMRMAIVDCTSASAPFINEMSGRNRVVVTATKSGAQYNFARFGDYISAAIADETVDLDKDGQTSLLEAFLAASARVQEFYDSDARLATEHALIDDNGDGLGTPADWFSGYRTAKSAKDGQLPDGTVANQFILIPRGAEANLPPDIRVERDALEIELAALRERKQHLDPEEYDSKLEEILLRIAHLYERAEPAQDQPSPNVSN